MSRHEDKIYNTKVKERHEETGVLKLKRLECGTYFNIEKMYNLIYNELVLSGVAVKVSEKQYYNVKGEMLPSVDGIFGKPTDIDLVAPEYILFVEEC
jgi:hypothetical protein